MDLGIGNRFPALEDVEIAAFVGLPRVLREDRAEPARESRLPAASTRRGAE
jgi:hypothetical protein